MYWLPAGTSTYWYWIPKCTPTPAVRLPSPPKLAPLLPAAGGKETKKKDLGLMAMSYGYVYVAQVAMGADPAQTLKAIREAEAYPGPSLVICYCPCIEHGMKCGMGLSQNEEKKAVEAGYWHLYRFDPDKKKAGENPFTLDSKKPTGDFRAFLLGQNRYASLKLSFPDKAE